MAISYVFNVFTGNLDVVDGTGSSASNSFETWTTPDGNSIVADSSTDTAIFANGAGILITSVPGTDTVTIASTITQYTDAMVLALLIDANIPNNITLDNITQITTRSHTSLTDIGTNTHAAIDTHIADATIHFTQASISITASQVSNFSEAVDDRLDALLQDNQGISWSYDDGANTLTPVVGSFTIGTGAAGVDYTLTFNGETADGVITWMEDEDQFRFNDTGSFYRNDTSTNPSLYIEQDGAGDAAISWLLTAGQEFRAYTDNSDNDSWKVEDVTGADVFLDYDPSTGIFIVGVAGSDVQIGDGLSEIALVPGANLMCNLGTTSLNWGDIFCGGQGKFSGGSTAQAPINILASVAPTSPAADDFWNDTSQKALIAFLNGGLKHYYQAAFFTSSATVTVANTTTETTLLGAGIGSLTIPASFFVVGKTIRLRMYGVYSTEAVPITLRIRIKLDSSNYGDTTAITTAGSLSNRFWCIEMIMTCRSTGAGGSVFTQAYFLHQDNAVATAAPSMWTMSQSGAQGIDTTDAKTVEVTAQWGAGADAADSISCTHVTLEVLA